MISTFSPKILIDHVIINPPDYQSHTLPIQYTSQNNNSDAYNLQNNSQT